MASRLTIAFVCRVVPTSTEDSRQLTNHGLFSNLPLGLASRGHQIHIVLPNAAELPSNRVDDGIQIHRIDQPYPDNHDVGSMTTYCRGIAARLHELEKNHKLDVVHIEDPSFAGWAYVPSEGTALSISVGAEDPVIDRSLLGSPETCSWSTELARATLGRCHHVATNSERFKQHLLERPRQNPQLVSLISRCIDLDDYSPASMDASPETDKKTVVLGLANESGEEAFSRITELVARRHPNTECRLIEPGKSNLLEELHNADVVVSLPRNSGLGATEAALACGKAIVLSRADSAASILTPGENAHIVPAGDPQAWADAVECLLENTQLRRQFGASARSVAEKQFAAQTILDSIERGFQTVHERIEEPRGSDPTTLNVAIVTHDESPALKRTLDRLRGLSNETSSIFVCDLGSTDGTRGWLREWSDDVHRHTLLHEARNANAPASPTVAGRNTILHEVLRQRSAPNGHAIIFVPCGAEVGKDRIRALSNMFSKSERIGIAINDEVIGIRVETAREVGPFDEWLDDNSAAFDDYRVRAKALGWTVVSLPNDPPSTSDQPDDSKASRQTTAKALLEKWSRLGIIDESGKLIEQGRKINTSAAVVERLADILGRPRIPSGEVQRAARELSVLLDTSQPDESPGSLHPISSTVLGLLELHLNQSMVEKDTDEAKRCEQLRESIESNCISAAHRSSLALPPSPEVPPRGGVRISKAAQIGDWDRPEWFNLTDKVLLEGDSENIYARNRFVWQRGQIIEGLCRLGLLNPNTRGLAVGDGGNRLLFALANYVEQIVSVDLYDEAGEAAYGVPRDLPEHPDRSAPFPYRTEHLQMLRMNPLDLRLDDGSFDFALCLTGESRIHGREDPSQALLEVARVLKPGGFVAVAADVLLTSGQDERWLSAKDLFVEWIRPTGLTLIEEIDFSIDDWTLERVAEESDRATEEGAFIRKVGDHLVGSVVFFLQKPSVRWKPRSEARSGPIRSELLTPTVDDRPGQIANESVTIGIDARNLYYSNSITRGIGHYTLYHLEATARKVPNWRFICYGEKEPPKAMASWLELPNISFRYLEDYRDGEVDLLHIPDSMNLSLGFDSPLRIFREPRMTITFHDLIPLRIYWDNWPEVNRRTYLSRLSQIRRSHARIMTNSEFTRNDLLRATGIDPARVETISAGLNTTESSATDRDSEAARKRELGIDRPFFLWVGAIDPHKNFDTALRAFRRLLKTHDAQLVMVGKKDDATKRFEKSLKKEGMDRVVFTDFISRETLEILYREAIALLFPSRYEGFGFPTLEAMASGCAVLASNTTSIPEVAGDAAIQFDPYNLWELSQAMADLLDKPQLGRELRERGLERAQMFSWDRVAERTIAIWDRMITSIEAPPATANPSAHQFEHV